MWFVQVVPASAVIGFGLTKWSKDRFETNAKKLELLTPYYDELQKATNRSFDILMKAQENLVRVIGSTMGQSIYDTHETLPEYLKREPYKSTMLGFPVSGHLPKKCQALVKDLMPIFEDSVDLLNDVSEHYRSNTFYQDTFEEQKANLNANRILLATKIGEIDQFIEKDKLRLTRSVRRRFTFG